MILVFEGSLEDDLRLCLDQGFGDRKGNENGNEKSKCSNGPK